MDNNFNNKLLNRLVRTQFKTNKNFLVALNNSGIEIKEDAIKKWRQGSASPKIGILGTVAKLLNCSVVDFFPDSEKEKEKIAFEEIRQNPKAYINVLIASLRDIEYSDEDITLLEDALSEKAQ